MVIGGANEGHPTKPALLVDPVPLVADLELRPGNFTNVRSWGIFMILPHFLLYLGQLPYSVPLAVFARNDLLGAGSPRSAKAGLWDASPVTSDLHISAPRKQSSDTHGTPYDRVKRCWERKKIIRVSERCVSEIGRGTCVCGAKRLAIFLCSGGTAGLLSRSPPSPETRRLLGYVAYPSDPTASPCESRKSRLIKEVAYVIGVMIYGWNCTPESRVQLLSVTSSTKNIYVVPAVMTEHYDGAKPMRAKWGKYEGGWGKREIPEKIRRPAASSSTVPTCGNPGATPPGIEPGSSPRWSAVAERLACSPPTKANRVQSPAGSLPDFRTWESFRTMPLVGGVFSGISVPQSPSSALKTSLLRAAQISSLPLSISSFTDPTVSSGFNRWFGCDVCCSVNNHETLNFAVVLAARGCDYSPAVIAGKYWKG
ncbi:hypothetical protein PR048_006965 [Dryococelus australis]|uniref:Uncharacterized protein n=1 Tax=Dryococelus australis TaxID=614101 RepID=A0ABQ9IDM1_9NEOP|nr:hypothetical protein PR048_006965 [Dryococelus australis]